MEASTYIKMLQFFKKYDAHIKTYYTGGNHDYSDITKTSMDLLTVLLEGDYLKNFHLYLKPAQVEIDGIKVNMLPHPHLESIKSKRPCLNFVHVEYTGALGDNGRELRSKHEFVCPKRDYTISGHIHQYQHLKKRRAIYCGTPYQTTFGESLPKGFIEIKAKEVGGRIELKHKFIDNKPQFQLLTVHIESQKDFSLLSTEPGTRYRLYVAEGVVVPSDLMLSNPNIAQLWSSKAGKIKADTDAEQFALETKRLPSINPTEGLAKVFKSNGLNKKDYMAGKLLVKQALSEIGFDE
jgi:hypothetical protein